MNLREAYEVCKAGEKVREKIWPDNIYVYYEDGRFHANFTTDGISFMWNWNDNRDTWEIYREPMNIYEAFLAAKERRMHIRCPYMPEDDYIYYNDISFRSRKYGALCEGYQCSGSWMLVPWYEVK